MAKTITDHNVSWNTVHDNGPFDTETLYETLLDDSISNDIDRYNDASIEICRLIEKCRSDNKRFRAYGSSWSTSKIAHQQDRMHYNAAMDISIRIAQDQLHTSSSFKSENLFLFQCGNTIKQVSRELLKHKKSLKTSGASNGQTIAGAVSTGVHGSAFDVGAMQDYVVGINLIIGPTPNDLIYLERHTQPALNDQFATSLKSRIIRNDGLFNAALVGLGSFGFMAGLVIEAEDVFLLKRYTKAIKKLDAVELAESLNFEDSNFKIDSELNPDGTGKRPYHFKVYINPYNEDEDGVVEIMYKKSYREDYPNPIPIVAQYIFKDLPSWIASFAAKHKRMVPKIIRALKKIIFPTLDQVSEGTLADIFWDSTFRGAGFAWALGIDHKDTKKALDLFVKLLNEEGPVPGAIAIRFVKASKATLAFTKFPITCILEMDGIQWKPNRRMISMEDIERKIIEKFMAHKIPFTWHWGKNATWNFPGLIDYMYGDKDDEWKNYRSALLSREMADLFTNDFLIKAGLGDYRKNVPSTLIDSLNVNTNNTI